MSGEPATVPTEGDPIEQSLARWAEAEQAGDVDSLGALTVDGFLLVGPLGFVLDKQAWLDRYRTRSLLTRSITRLETDIRRFANAAVAVGLYHQRAEYQGHPIDGQFRATYVLVTVDAERWQLASIHVSQVPAPQAR